MTTPSPSPLPTRQPHPPAKAPPAPRPSRMASRFRTLLKILSPPPAVRAFNLLLRALRRHPAPAQPLDTDALHVFWDFTPARPALADIFDRHLCDTVHALRLGKRQVHFHVLVDHASLAPQATPRSFEVFPVTVLSPMFAGLTLYHTTQDFHRAHAALAARQSALSPDILLDTPAPFAPPDHAPILAHFAAHAGIPRLTTPASTATWARGFAGSFGHHFLLCIHFQPDSPGTPADPADHANWLAFLDILQKRYPRVLVILLGDLPPGTTPPGNVILPRQMGYGLLEELALIQESDLFMGLSCGPAQYAYFGLKPYVLIDSPASHPILSARRAISPDLRHPPFASPNQQLYVGSPTPAELMTLFESIYQL
jgi:hypothetical protein